MERCSFEMEAILKRLDQLERQNRRLKRLAAVGIIVVGCTVLMAQTVSSNHTVEAEKFLLVDGDGRSRAELSADGATTRLMFYSADGRKTVSVTSDLQGNESNLSLFSKYGIRMSVSAFLDSGVVSLAETKGSSDWRYHFWLGEHGGPNYNSALYLSNGRGVDASLQVGGNGPSLELGTSEGTQTVVGSASVPGGAGERRRTSVASIVMLGRDGKLLWHAP